MVPDTFFPRSQSASFFSRLLQRSTSVTDRCQADLDTTFLFQFSLQFAQINVGTGGELGHQPIRPRVPFWLTWGRFLRCYLPCLTTLLFDFPHPRICNLETHRDRVSSLVRVASGEHFATKFRVVWFHRDHLLEMTPTLPCLRRARQSNRGTALAQDGRQSVARGVSPWEGIVTFCFRAAERRQSFYHPSGVRGK